MNFDQLKGWGLGAISASGVAVAGKVVWQLITRRSAIRAINANSTKTEVEALNLPFQQATELMKMLRSDLDNARIELSNARRRADELERRLEICRRALIRAGIVCAAADDPPDDIAK